MSDAIVTSRRRPLRISVRGLCLFILAFGCALGILVDHHRMAEQQRRAVAAIQGSRGFVEYDWEYRAPGQGIRRPPPEWLADRLGVDHFSDVTRIRLFFPSDEVLIHVGSLRRLEYLAFGPGHGTGLDLRPLQSLSRLQELRLQGFPVTDRDLVPIGRLTELRALNLNESLVGDAGLAVLQNLTRLRRLGLWRTRVTERGLRHLDAMTDLQFLDLGGTEVRDPGLVHLGRLRRLRELNLSYSGVSDVGLAELTELHELERLDIRGTNVEDEGIFRLRKALPRTAILGGHRAPRLEPWQEIRWVDVR